MRYYNTFGYTYIIQLNFITIVIEFQGVQTIINCAVDSSLEGKGGFYRNCLPYESKIQFDRDTQEKLWDVSEALIEPALKKDK